MSRAASASDRQASPVSSFANGSLFCSKPFTWFEVSRGNREGEVFLCCPTWLDTPAGNIDEQTVAEIWNGPVAQDIRQSILDGTFKYCRADRCPHLQALTAPVQRLENVTDPLMQGVIAGQLTVVPWGPKEVNCSYDRSCNLSCPSCRTELIVETARRDQIARIQQRLTEEAFADAELLYITGSGDPFGSPFFRKWLRTMRSEDMPRLQQIYLHTNALLWTPEMWETIPADIRPLVRITEISIDAATPETYAINRRGGKFDTLLRNLEFISTLRRNGPLRELVVHMVVQENNFREMPAFVELGRRFRADRVYFSCLVNWGTFSEEAYQQRAIHDVSHPLHSDLRAILQHPALRDPVVDLGNLTALRATEAPSDVPPDA